MNELSELFYPFLLVVFSVGRQGVIFPFAFTDEHLFSLNESVFRHSLKCGIQGAVLELNFTV